MLTTNHGVGGSTRQRGAPPSVDQKQADAG